MPVAQVGTGATALTAGAAETDVYTTPAHDGATGKSYEIVVDIDNLAIGDTLEVKFYERVVNGGGYRLVHARAVSGPATGELIKFYPFAVTWQGKFALKLTGVTKTITWSVRTLD